MYRTCKCGITYVYSGRCFSKITADGHVEPYKKLSTLRGWIDA